VGFATDWCTDTGWTDLCTGKFDECALMGCLHVLNCFFTFDFASPVEVLRLEGKPKSWNEQLYRAGVVLLDRHVLEAIFNASHEILADDVRRDDKFDPRFV
jgi:hypothetical protein